MSFPKPLTTLAALAVLSAFASTSVHADPAPNLSSVRVYAVGSSNYGDWEFLPTGALSTANDHGGQVQVAVLEFGYGVNPVATMNGNSVSIYESTAVCGPPSNFNFPCTNGQTMTGTMYIYDVSGYQNGTFAYQHTSINAGGTLYAQIYIQ